MGIGTILTQFANRNKSTSKSIPMLNEMLIPTNYAAGLKSNMKLNRKKGMMGNYMNIPELTALINKVANDANEQFTFEPLDKKSTGRNKILNAKVFAQNVNLRQTIQSLFIDIVDTGEGFGWIGKLTKEQVDNIVTNRMKELDVPITPYTKEIYYKINFSDEDALKPRKFRYVASSTMEIIHSEIEIDSYLQKVGATEQTYRKDEIIHFKFLDVDGKVSGFSPVRAILVQLELLYLMWQNQLALARNGGKPSQIISVEDIDSSTPAFKRIEQELRKYNVIQNRHGTLLLNGKVKVAEMAQLDSMQFKDMGLYITGLIAMQWGIPRSSIPFIVGGTNTKDDTGGNSEKGYWRNIERLQDSFADVINTQLFIPYFGVMLKFKKAYKHDELVEAQVTQTKLNNLTFMNNELMKVEKKLSPEYLMKSMGIDEDDVVENPKEEMFQDNGMFRQNQMNNQDLDSNKDKDNKRQQKRDEKNSSQDSMGKPTGFGKEMEAKEELSVKERQRIPFLSFVRLYNEDKNQNIDPPRVFYSEQDGITRMAYMSTDFVYETVVATNQVNIATLMNFSRLYKVDEDQILEPVDFVQTGELEGEDGEYDNS